MIQKAEFEKLQFGDKLAQITENGELYTYKYIGRDPGWENGVCLFEWWRW